MSPVRVIFSPPAAFSKTFPNGTDRRPVKGFQPGWEPTVSCNSDGTEASLAHRSLVEKLVVTAGHRERRTMICTYLKGGIRNCQTEVTLKLINKERG